MKKFALPVTVKSSKIVALGAVLAATLCLAGTARATSVNVSVWANATAYNPSSPNTPFAIPSGTPNITLTLSNPTSGLLFNLYSSTNDSLTAFMTQQYGGVPNGNSVAYVTGGNQTGSCPPSPLLTACGINNDVMEFQGTTYLVNGATYTITHDDGLDLFINGTSEVINAGQPTSADSTSFTWGGSTGTQDFTMWYSEVNGGPAEVYSADFYATPEPSSLLLLGTGLLGLAFVAFRKAKPSRSMSSSV